MDNTKAPQTVLLTFRYHSWRWMAGFYAMPVFTIFAWFTRKRFKAFKPMGCGRGGGFGAVPSAHHWALLYVPVNPDETRLPRLCAWWLRRFNPDTKAFLLEPMEGHGTWDGAEIFGQLPRKADWNGPLGILTRATLRPRSIRSFFRQVKGVQQSMKGAAGLQYSIGMGEVPLFKQATFSQWTSVEAMKEFAYKMQAHRQVVQQTRQEGWYSEEMFVRFRILAMATGQAREVIDEGGNLILQAI